LDFDSHMSGVVLATANAVNVLSPGWAHGREYVPPAGAALGEKVRTALGAAGARTAEPIADEQLEELAGHLVRLRAVFTRVATGDLDGACALVNGMIRDTAAAPVLARHDGEPWHLHFHALDASWAHGWAASMATALAVVLGSPMHDRLGVCQAPNCDRVYVDTSRNGARRFCSTACQNRVKAASFREKRREDGRAGPGAADEPPADRRYIR